MDGLIVYMAMWHVVAAPWLISYTDGFGYSCQLGTLVSIPTTSGKSTGDNGRP